MKATHATQTPAPLFNVQRRFARFCQPKMLARTGQNGSCLDQALKAEGWTVQRAHGFDQAKQHGFIDSQKMGMEVFRNSTPDAPLIVAECVWAIQPSFTGRAIDSSRPYPDGGQLERHLARIGRNVEFERVDD